MNQTLDAQSYDLCPVEELSTVSFCFEAGLWGPKSNNFGHLICPEQSHSCPSSFCTLQKRSVVWRVVCNWSESACLSPFQLIEFEVWNWPVIHLVTICGTLIFVGPLFATDQVDQSLINPWEWTFQYLWANGIGHQCQHTNIPTIRPTTEEVMTYQ